MIVVDGRTDEEKLRELLAGGAEETSLDFKATLDLSAKSSKAVLEFAKDVISMGNLPDGGYIVIGVDDQGRPAHNHQALDLAEFDSAKLRSKVAKYVEAPVRLVSQPHKVDGRDVVLVYVEPSLDGLPVPTSSIGQFDSGGGRMQTVFSVGEVLLREGTSNVRLRYAHWDALLARYRERVRAEARADVDALIHRVVETLQAGGPGARAVPLDVEMSDEALAEALLATFESANTVRLQQFLNTSKQVALGSIENREDWLRALDRIAVVATQAVMYRQDDAYRLAVDALEAIYRAQNHLPDAVRLSGSHVDSARNLLDVLLRVMAIGSIVVRQEAWSHLGTLTLRPVQVADHYRYTSWLRHGTVQAARAGLLQGKDGENRGGQFISLTRALTADTPSLRPDYPAEAPLPKAEDLAPQDWLLNSICQFDLWWCILAAASESVDHGGVFFPSCAALHQHRSQPTLERIAASPDVRRAAFGDDVNDDTIARAVADVVKVAEQQSRQYGGWWGGLDESAVVARFVTDHT